MRKLRDLLTGEITEISEKDLNEMKLRGLYHNKLLFLLNNTNLCDNPSLRNLVDTLWDDSVQEKYENMRNNKRKELAEQYKRDAEMSLRMSRRLKQNE